MPALRRLFILTSLLLLFTQTNALACTMAQSNMNAGKVSFDCLQVEGQASFHGTEIHQLQVKGNLQAYDAKFSQLKVQGFSLLKNTVVAGPAQFYGAVQATDSSFNSSVDLHGSIANFRHTQLQKITITSSHTARLRLLDGSSVQGDIRFIGSRGIVEIQKSELKGKLINGTLVQLP